MQKYLKIHSNDNVAVALAPLSKGLIVELGSQTVTLSEDIPQGHKFALTDIKTDEPVIKYGSQIGLAKEDITTGSWIHTHNIRTVLATCLLTLMSRFIRKSKKPKNVSLMVIEEATEKSVFVMKSGLSRPLAVSTMSQLLSNDRLRFIKKEPLKKSLLSHTLTDVLKWETTRNIQDRFLLI